MDKNVSIRQFPSPEHPYIAFPQKNLAVLDISRFTFCKVDFFFSSLGFPRFLYPGNSILIILLQYTSPNIPTFPLSWQLHPHHTSPNIPIIFPLYMSIPPQSCLSCFLSKPSHLCCPSDVLIPDLVHSCHS